MNELPEAIFGRMETCDGIFTFISGLDNEELDAAANFFKNLHTQSTDEATRVKAIKAESMFVKGKELIQDILSNRGEFQDGFMDSLGCMHCVLKFSRSKGTTKTFYQRITKFDSSFDPDEIFDFIGQYLIIQ